MNMLLRAARNAFALVPLLAVLSCGGGDPPSSASTGAVTAASNVVAVTVDSGPTSTSGSVNTLFTNVTVCVPGSTTQCQTIDHVQVDTGSYGFRVLASVLTLALPVTATANGSSLVECTQFVDGYSWGPVALADLQVSGEKAAGLPIQVIGDPNFATVPAACSSAGMTAEDTVATFGANGILGIGVFQQDCGAECVTNADLGYYYSCTQAGVCTSTTVELGGQVLNPVPLFTTDNNGTFIDLPAVADPGSTTVTGSLIFGIDTESNNQSGTQTVLTLDGSGNFTTEFNGQSLPDSFIDSGTNGTYFTDTHIAQCTNSSFSGFYCPSSTLNLSGTLGTHTTVSFTVANAQTLATDNSTLAALPQLAGTFTSDTSAFDWGLPFYYGRRIATGIEGYTTSAATGPYVAF